MNVLASQRQRGGRAVEAEDIGQHAQECRAQQIAALRENRVQVATRPFQPAVRQRNGERHIGRGGGNVELFKQLHQVRIGTVIEDQEAGIHAVRDAVEGHVHRVRMTAKVAAGLEQCHLDTRLGLCQPIGAREPRNPRSDYRNFHDGAPCVFVFCVDCLMALTALCPELPAGGSCRVQGDLRNPGRDGCTRPEFNDHSLTTFCPPR